MIPLGSENAAAGSKSARDTPGPQPLLVDDISREILNWIFDGHYQEGQRLPSERALAQQFGASRVAVREALRRMKDGACSRPGAARESWSCRDASGA